MTNLGQVLSSSCRNPMNVSELIASVIRMWHPSVPKEPNSLTDFLENPCLMVSCPLAGRHPYPAPDQIWTATSSDPHHMALLVHLF